MEIKLIEPNIEDYWYEQKLLSDPETMGYNAGWDVDYSGYDFESGCIQFPKESWQDNYKARKNNSKKYFAYIFDTRLSLYVGYVNLNFIGDKWNVGVVVESKYRGDGYGRLALVSLCDLAFSQFGAMVLLDSFESTRTVSLELFKSVGFEIVGESNISRFHKPVVCYDLALAKDKFYALQSGPLR